jgi:hypothetical protein
MAEIVDCPERDRLSNERDRAYGRHAEALAQLRSQGLTAPDKLKTAISDSRIDLEIAELVLQNHVRLHKCGSPPASHSKRLRQSENT